MSCLEEYKSIFIRLTFFYFPQLYTILRIKICAPVFPTVISCSFVSHSVTRPPHSEDEVAEWLRPWTVNPMSSARVGSNPFFIYLFFIISQQSNYHGDSLKRGIYFGVLVGSRQRLSYKTTTMDSKGVSFQGNCGAASVGEYNTVTFYCQLS